MDNLTLEQAFHNVMTACRQFRGTLDEHTAIQTSLKMIQDKLFIPKTEDLKVE